MNKKTVRGPMGAVVAYLLLAVLCVVVAGVYALFGHGVRSVAMDWMFLYPLAASVLFLLARILHPTVQRRPLYRLAANLLGTGVSTLTAGAMLRGILEIAGATSPYLAWFTAVGWSVGAVGVILLALLAVT